MTKVIADIFTKDAIILINRCVGESGVIRDEGTLDHILYQMKKTRGVNKKSAILMIKIAREHPFVDGNKRTAYESAKYFLSLHGKKLRTKTMQSKFDLMFRIANGTYNLTDVTYWIANHTE